MGYKTLEQIKVFNNLEKFYNSREVTKQNRMERNKKENRAAGLKKLTPKQMLQRLPIAFPQVKAGNNTENLLNEIGQIVYSLYQSKEITKNVYNNIIKSIYKHKK